MPFFDKIKISKYVLTHKSLTGNAPSYINDLFVTNFMSHNRSTRHGSINLVCPISFSVIVMEAELLRYRELDYGIVFPLILEE